MILKKICFVATNAYPAISKVNGIFGGAELNMYFLALQFSQSNDYKVIFLTGDYGQKQVVRIDNIEVHKLKFYSHSSKSHIKVLLREIFLAYKLLTIDADVFINTCAGSMIGRIAFFAKAIRKKKIIFRLANDIDTQKDFFKFEQKPFIDKLYYYGLKNTDRIVAQTNYQKRELKRNFKLDAKVIKNGFPVERTEIIAKKEYILWVGRGTSEKRPELFIEIARNVKNMRFVMILSGSDAYSEKIIKAAKQLENIEIYNGIPFDKIQLFFDKSIFLVNTSEYEGYPNTFIQAGIAKTPIISLSIDPDNIIKEYRTGFYCEGILEKAINVINISDVQEIKQRGMNNYLYVKKNNNIKDTYKNYQILISG